MVVTTVIEECAKMPLTNFRRERRHIVTVTAIAYLYELAQIEDCHLEE